MPVLTASQINDIVMTTLKEEGPVKFTQIITKLVNYDIYKQWFKRDFEQVPGGYSNVETVAIRPSEAAQRSSLFDKDSAHIVDMFGKVEAPWVNVKTHWAFERRELLMNYGSRQIVDLIKARRWNAMISLAELLETEAWSMPDPSDPRAPYSIPYWFTKNKTEGFYGMNPDGFANVGGIDATKEPMWRNWTAEYSKANDDDLLEKMRTAHRHIKWQSPIMVKGLRDENHEDYRIYVNNDVYGKMNKLGRTQNENLGVDLNAMEGEIVFKRHSIIYSEHLNQYEDNPVYMINHKTIGAKVLQGDVFHETPPKPIDDSHNSLTGWVDLTYCIMGRNRRCNAVFTQKPGQSL